MLRLGICRALLRVGMIVCLFYPVDEFNLGCLHLVDEVAKVFIVLRGA